MRFLQAGPWRLVPELFFLKSRAIILLTAMLLPCRILNPTISWTLQSRLPPAIASPTSPFLFLNTRSSNTSLPVGFPTPMSKLPVLCRSLLGSCVPGCDAFPAAVGVGMRTVGLWWWQLWQLSVEGLIYFLWLISWPVVNTHNRNTRFSLSLNSYP